MNQDPNSVLVVDQDASVRRGIAYALRGTGIDVREASDLKSAQRELDGCCVDAALVDLHLIDQQSFGLISWLRHACPGMPVVAAATHGVTARWAKARECGAQAILVKPFSSIALLAVLRHAIGTDRGAPSTDDDPSPVGR
jgi:DNA-binding response OmpR family regulator